MQALKGQKGGFTLVELIVVITILAILATVGFISYQNYTKDARSATVIQNIDNLVSALNIQGANATNMTTLIDTGATDRTVVVGTGKTVLGHTGATGLTIKAGTVDWTAVKNVQKADMASVNGDEPLVGYASTSINSSLQVASTIKKGDEDVVYIKAGFTADSTGSTAAQGLISRANPADGEIKDKDVGNHFTY